MIIGLDVNELAEYNPFSINENGQKTWSHCPGDSYHVTGKDRNGKRFKIVTSNWQHAHGINVWQGTKWLVRGNRRFVICRIYN